VKITMTKETGKILSAMHGIKISGKPNFASAVQIAEVCNLLSKTFMLTVTASSQASAEQTAEATNNRLCRITH